MGAQLSLFCKGIVLSRSLDLSSLVEDSALGNPADGLSSVHTIVWAPLFLPLLDTDERDGE